MSEEEKWEITEWTLSGLCFISAALLVGFILAYRKQTFIRKRSPLLLVCFLVGVALLDVCSALIRYHPVFFVCRVATFIFDLAVMLVVIPYVLRCLRLFFVFFGHRHALSTTNKPTLFLSRAKETFWLKLLGVLMLLCLVADIVVALVPHSGERCESSGHQKRIHSEGSLIIFGCIMGIFSILLVVFFYILRNIHDAFSISSELRIVGGLYLLYTICIFISDLTYQSYPIVIAFVLSLLVQVTSGYSPLLHTWNQHKESKNRQNGMMGLPLLVDSPDDDTGFAAVMRSDSGRTALREFLALEFSSETLLFVDEVSDSYEKLSQNTPLETRQAIAQRIVDKYVREGTSVHEVNVPGNMRKRCVSVVDSGCAESGTFEELRDYMLRVIRSDPFPRFQNHRLFKDWAARRNKEADVVQRARDAGML